MVNNVIYDFSIICIMYYYYVYMCMFVPVSLWMCSCIVCMTIYLCLYVFICFIYVCMYYSVIAGECVKYLKKYVILRCVT